MPQAGARHVRVPAVRRIGNRMKDFLLQHQHESGECEASFAAWHGFDSPLRGISTPSTCLAGDHRIWWFVCARDEAGALGQLPPYVAERTHAVHVRSVEIP